MTKKLYYDDSYVTEFKGNVIDVIPYNKGYAAILDETYFYPESGGQPSDTGYIDDARVLDVEFHDGIVYHILDKPLEIGTYKCKIDFDKRFQNMQQHTGQHILSAAFIELFNASTDSFHIGDEMSHIDIDKPGLSQAEIMSVEMRANEIVYNNIPVLSYIVTGEEAANFPLRKHPSVDKDIRIVEIKSYDYSPCGGTHVRNTGEIGIIKITKWEKSKNKLRIYFACGKKALVYFRKINKIIYEIADHFSANISDIPNRINTLELEKRGAQKEISTLKNELALYISDSLYNKCEKLNSNTKLIIDIFNEYDEELLRIISFKLSQKPKTLAILGNVSKQKFIISRSEDLDLNLKELFSDIYNHFECNGGGSVKQVQYVINGDTNKVVDFLKGKIEKAVSA